MLGIKYLSEYYDNVAPGLSSNYGSVKFMSSVSGICIGRGFTAFCRAKILLPIRRSCREEIHRYENVLIEECLCLEKEGVDNWRVPLQILSRAFPLRLQTGSVDLGGHRKPKHEEM